MRSLVLLAGLASFLCETASAGSILVPNAGVEAYRSWVLYSVFRGARFSVADTSLNASGLTITTGYGVAGTVLIGSDMQVQHIRAPGGIAQTMFAPTALRAKWNFWSKLNSGEYHRLALIGRLGLPARRQGGLVAVDEPLQAPALKMLDSGVTPALDLVYSRSKGRWVYGAGLGYMLPLVRAGSRAGREAVGMIDAEYLVKRWGDSELSLVFGASSRSVTRADYRGRKLMNTGGNELTTSYGVQIALHSTYAIEFAKSRESPGPPAGTHALPPPDRPAVPLPRGLCRQSH